MDATDLAILREIGRDKVLWWGSLDPRLSSREIAGRLRLPESTVRSRVRAWERSGFLLGYETLPNPALFGASLGGGSLSVESARAKSQVLDDLALVEGVILAQDHVGPWIGLAYASKSPHALSRLSRLVARLPGVARVEACKPFSVPAATIVPSALDWRILRALGAEARAPLSQIATKVGVSVRTLTRRYGGLVAGGAVWSIPVLDFTRYEGAVAARFIVDLARGADAARVARRLRERVGTVVEMERSRETIPEFAEGAIEALVHLPSVGAVEDVEREILDLPGVEGVEVVFPRRMRVYPAWFEERVSARLLS